MSAELIEYLKGPELVVQIQEWFGVKYLPDSDNSSSSGDDQPLLSSKSNGLHKRTVSNGSSETDEGFYNDNYSNGHAETNVIQSTKCVESEEDSGNETKAKQKYQITNRFWYYLFIIGTELGDEIFYATMIPFWFWNIDGAVGRRVVFVWAIVMYIGQGLKDIIKWQRPGPPVQRLQNKWSIEYGMPSTHAMVAVSMPFSVVIFMLDRYQYSAVIGLTIATIWCSIICMSRLYLGMHSVLDIIAGLLLTILLMIPVIPLVDKLDFYILSSKFSPIIILIISILLIVYYPRSDKWTPTRGDTTMTISVTAGIQIGGWINYQLGDMQPSTTLPPYEIIWPTYGMLGLMLLRTILGLCCVLATRAIAKSISYGFVCALLGKDKNELRNSKNTLENRDKIIVELCYKYFTCAMIGLNTQYLLPNVFKLLNIGRPDFYTEI